PLPVAGPVPNSLAGTAPGQVSTWLGGVLRGLNPPGTVPPRPIPWPPKPASQEGSAGRPARTTRTRLVSFPARRSRDPMEGLKLSSTCCGEDDEGDVDFPPL